MCCRVLLCVAVRCRLLHCVALRCVVLHCAALCCIVLRSGAECCSMLKCFAVCGLICQGFRSRSFAQRIPRCMCCFIHTCMCCFIHTHTHTHRYIYVYVYAHTHTYTHAPYVHWLICGKRPRIQGILWVFATQYGIDPKHISSRHLWQRDVSLNATLCVNACVHARKTWQTQQPKASLGRERAGNKCM